MVVILLNPTDIASMNLKVTFGATADWQEWSQEMEDYCIQDVTLTTKLWQHFQPYLNSSN